MTNASTPSADHSNEASAQQTLLEYRAILENASVGIMFTRDQRVLHCNPRASEIYGWPHGELVGQSGAVFWLSPDDYAEIGRTATPILSSAGLLDIEMPMRRKDGRTVYCRVRAKAINPRNTAEGTIWIVEDIDERKRAEAELQELLQRQQAILENASIGIMFTRDGEIVHCNPRTEAILGWPAGTLVGQRGEAIFTDAQNYASFGQTVGPKLAAGELIDLEWLNARQDGSLVWCRFLAKALPCADGSRSTIWITEDISDKKAAQEALASAHQELEQRVRERTDELAQANARLMLEVAERKLAQDEILRLNSSLEVRVQRRTAQLEASNRDLEAFAHSVAHDLRQPFIAIGGFSGLLERMLVDEGARHYIERIKAGVKQAGELTEALLALANLSRVELRLQEVDLSALCFGVIDKLQQNDPARECRIHIEPGLRAQADAMLVGLVLEELLGNAWKFSSLQGCAEISFGLQAPAPEAQAPDTGTGAVYVVRDNGEGFDMAHADKLFRSFQRLHSPLEFSGTGVGLANVQRIVARHAGRIWAESTPGKGASFYFTLGGSGTHGQQLLSMK